MYHEGSAFPRNVDPDVERLNDVYLYDIDDLEAVIEDSIAERRRQVPKVEVIVAEKQGGFMTWWRSLDVVPTIVGLQKQADSVRQAELERTLRRLNNVSDREREIIQAMISAQNPCGVLYPARNNLTGFGLIQKLFLSSVTRLLCGMEGPQDSLRYRWKRTAVSTLERKPIVVWNSTKACNLRCIHCYYTAHPGPDPDELSTAEARAFIDDLADFGAPVLVFSGGEPFLRDDLRQPASDDGRYRDVRSSVTAK